MRLYYLTTYLTAIPASFLLFRLVRRYSLKTVLVVATLLTAAGDFFFLLVFYFPLTIYSTAVFKTVSWASSPSSLSEWRDSGSSERGASKCAVCSTARSTSQLKSKPTSFTGSAFLSKTLKTASFSSFSPKASLFFYWAVWPCSA